MLALVNGKYIEQEEHQETISEIEIPYEEKVVALIRERYSIDEELAIQRQRDTKPDEFQAYFDYCEECKEKAKGESK